MKKHPSRKTDTWPRRVTLGRVKVTVYRRKTPIGNFAYMLANYASGKRRFDSYASEEDALDAAGKLARQLSQRDVLAAGMSNESASEYASAVQTLAPFGVSLLAAVDTVAACLKLVPDLHGVHAAVKRDAQRNRQVTAKRVADVVADLLAVKEARGASRRYMEDLRSRLNRFGEAFQKHTCNVTTAEIQSWLDGQKLAPGNYQNFRTVIGTLFQFAVARGFAADNPVVGIEKLDVRQEDIEVYTPHEIHRLLAVASPDYLPALAIGAFAGIRSAEIERLEWSDIDLHGRFITVGASRSKTASRRVVPITDNLAAWLPPYAGSRGKVWRGTHEQFYAEQQQTAERTAIEADPTHGIKEVPPVPWKANALRHSFASYRFAETGDAGRVAGELGNSAAVVHRHYRKLVKPADAARWFAVRPEPAVNVTPMPAAATA